MTVSKTSRSLPNLGTEQVNVDSSGNQAKGWLTRFAQAVGRWLGHLMVLVVVVIAAVSSSLAWSLNERLQESEVARKSAQKGNSGVEESLLKTQTELGKVQVQLYESEEEIKDLNAEVKARDAEIDVLRRMLAKQLDDGKEIKDADASPKASLESIFGK